MPLGYYITAFSYSLQQTHKAIMQMGLAQPSGKVDQWRGSKDHQLFPSHST